MLLKKDKPDNTKNGELKNNEPKKEVKILTKKSYQRKNK